MFDTNIQIITFTFSLIEVFILLGLLVTYFSRKSDRTRFRLIILISAYILYNIAGGLLPVDYFDISIGLQYILVYGSGVILASYFFYYLNVELKIYNVKLFSPKFLILSLVVFFIASFGGVYYFTNNLLLSKNVFVYLACLLAVFYCSQTVFYLVKQIKNYSEDTKPTKTMIVAGNFAIIFMTAMPVVAVFKNQEVLNHILVNISFFLVFYAYLRFFIFTNKKEYKMLLEYKESLKPKTQEEVLKKYKLTNRQIEVSGLILNGFSFQIISKKLFISGSGLKVSVGRGEYYAIDITADSMYWDLGEYFYDGTLNSGGIGSPPIINGNNIILNQGWIYNSSLNLINKTINWKTKISIANRTGGGTMVIKSGKLFQSVGNAGHFNILDATNGIQLATHTNIGTNFIGSPLKLYNNKIYFTTTEVIGIIDCSTNNFVQKIVYDEKVGESSGHLGEGLDVDKTTGYIYTTRGSNFVCIKEK